jgi:hypothetical protein
VVIAVLFPQDSGLHVEMALHGCRDGLWLLYVTGLSTENRCQHCSKKSSSEGQGSSQIDGKMLVTFLQHARESSQKVLRMSDVSTISLLVELVEDHGGMIDVKKLLEATPFFVGIRSIYVRKVFLL